MKKNTLSRATSMNARSSDLIADGLSNTNVAEKQIDGIIELREFDIPYHSRVCIDLKINIGLCSRSQNQLVLKPDLIEQPELIILAFDIELSYNSDIFDIPFIEQCAQFYGLNMFNEIGFRKDSQDYYLSRSCIHMDCIKWVKRDSYLPVGSHSLKAVKKLNYVITQLKLI
ncbi:unnamed protein product [Rotaria socialis]|uniref:DNA polymerase epsilon catalytic subunit n=1 Tax=Rotaria socialis TaxID=392032 RepID=A0A820U385_9BILA|nr:unnamed protein product [Rotaria socialis]CAF4476625.1 unnamed protein product [Rotaria socialis]CAF4739634.1 unnamed protein product [Rotaria socialis]